MSFSQHSIILLHIQYDYIYTWHIHGALPLAFPAPCCCPLAPLCVPPLYPLPLTWHPPVVIGIVHLPLRLLVN